MEEATTCFSNVFPAHSLPVDLLLPLKKPGLMLMLIQILSLLLQQCGCPAHAAGSLHPISYPLSCTEAPFR